MDAQQLQHAATAAGEALAFASLCLTALLSAVGTCRNLLSHAGFISVQERGKIGAVLDRFAFVCEKGKKGLAWVLSLPGFASQDKAAPPPDLKALVVLPLLLAVALQGCATSGMPATATVAQKAQADVLVAKQMRADIVAKCPKMAPVAPLIADAISVGTDYMNVLNDILTAVSAVPALVQDYDAVSCALKVVLDDYKTFFKAAPAGSPAAKAAAQKVSMLERVLVELGDSGAPDMQCASRR